MVHWARTLADKFESGEYTWIKGQLAKPSQPNNCHCLVGGMLAQAGAKFRVASMPILTEGMHFGNDYIGMATVFDIRTDMEAFGKYLGEYEKETDASRNIINWNDQFGREVDEVVEKLHEFADYEEGIE